MCVDFETNMNISMGSRVVKGARLKIWCDMLRGFEPHLMQDWLARPTISFLAQLAERSAVNR